MRSASAATPAAGAATFALGSGAGAGAGAGGGAAGVLSVRSGNGLTAGGYRIDYGTSYVQVVGFDERGPRAQALLTYGQSSDPASPHASDQLRLYSLKQWPALPFHREEVVRECVGPVLELRR